jgi:hypothetical protein
MNSPSSYVRISSFHVTRFRICHRFCTTKKAEGKHDNNDSMFGVRRQPCCCHRSLCVRNFQCHDALVVRWLGPYDCKYCSKQQISFLGSGNIRSHHCLYSKRLLGTQPAHGFAPHPLERREFPGGQVPIPLHKVLALTSEADMTGRTIHRH